jgi:hypothetical protein
MWAGKVRSEVPEQCRIAHGVTPVDKSFLEFAGYSLESHRHIGQLLGG